MNYSIFIVKSETFFFLLCRTLVVTAASSYRLSNKRLYVDIRAPSP